MPSPFDIAQAMARQQVEKKRLQSDAELQAIQAAYAPESYQAANALKRAEAMKVPYQIQDLESQVTHRNMLNQYMPIDYKIRAANLALGQDRLDWAKNQENYRSPYGKALRDFEYIKQKYGETSPQAVQFKSYLDSQGSRNGISVFDANGNPLVQIGGSSGAKGGGATYLNQATGEITSQPTAQIKSRLQKAAISNPQVVKNMRKIIAPISNYLGWQGKAKHGIQEIINSASGRFSNPIGDYNAAIDNINASAELLLNQFGLNVTDKSTENMASIMMPRKNDSPQSYERRILSHIEDEINRQKTTRNALTNGITVREPNVNLLNKSNMQNSFKFNPSDIPDNEIDEIMAERFDDDGVENEE